MSSNRHTPGHATDWTDSRATRANAWENKNISPADMESSAVVMLLGDTRLWHDR